MVSLIAYSGPGAPAYPTFPVTQGLTGAAIREKATVLVGDVQQGVVPLDREVAERLRRSGKPVLVAINKADHERAAAVMTGTWQDLGIELAWRAVPAVVDSGFARALNDQATAGGGFRSPSARHWVSEEVPNE